MRAWQGLNEHDNQSYAGFSVEPPDQGLCAANGHVLEMINDVVRLYTTAGRTEATAYLNDFFQEPGYQFTTDPSCVFDFGSGRFFATELTLDVDQKTGALTGKNWLDLAVSKTGDPTAGWNVYRIDVTDDGTGATPAHPDCPCIGDFPHLGTDANGVFLTTNEYPFSGPGLFGNNFNGSQVYVLSKAAVVSGSLRTNLVQFENTTLSNTSGHRRAGFTLWPAQAAGTNYATGRNGTMYFVSSLAAEEARPDDFNGYTNQLALWWVSNTASLNTGSPAVGLHVKRLTVPVYGIPPLASQKIGPTPLKDCLNVACRKGINDAYVPEDEGGLDSSDSRPLTAVYANGRVYSALDTALVVSGNVQSGFEWFGLQADYENSAVANDGYVGVARNNVIFPTIATDKSGNGYLSVTLSGADYFPSQAYMRWSNGAGSQVNIAAPGQAPEDGFCEYLFFNCAGTPTPQVRPRWGDYGYAAWDGHQFYMANEYIAKSCSFAEFNSDVTCGGSRTFYSNFSTHIQVLS